MKFVDTNGIEHEHAYVDGSHVEERVLEGVMILIALTKNGKPKASFQQKDHSYAETLNTKKFLKIAEGFAQDCINEGEWEMLSLDNGAELAGLSKALAAKKTTEKKTTAKKVAPNPTDPIVVPLSNISSLFSQSLSEPEDAKTDKPKPLGSWKNRSV